MNKQAEHVGLSSIVRFAGCSVEWVALEHAKGSRLHQSFRPAYCHGQTAVEVNFNAKGRQQTVG